MADVLTCPYKDAGCTYSARLMATMTSHVDNNSHLHTSLLLDSLKQVHTRLCQVESQLETSRTDLDAAQAEVEAVRGEFGAAKVQFQKDFNEAITDLQSVREELEEVKAELRSQKESGSSDEQMEFVKPGRKMPGAFTGSARSAAGSRGRAAVSTAPAPAPAPAPAQSSSMIGKRRSMFAASVRPAEPEIRDPPTVTSKNTAGKRRASAIGTEKTSTSDSLVPNSAKRPRQVGAKEVKKTVVTQTSDAEDWGGDDLVVDAGICEWSIDKWSTVLDEAKQSGGRVDKLGPIFYCCASGYRLQLKLRVYGGGGVDHSLCILKGNYDSQNEWPMPHKISIEDCRGKKKQWTEVASTKPQWNRHLVESDEATEEDEQLYNARLAYHKPSVGREGSYLWRLVVHHD